MTKISRKINDCNFYEKISNPNMDAVIIHPNFSNYFVTNWGKDLYGKFND